MSSLVAPISKDEAKSELLKILRVHFPEPAEINVYYWRGVDHGVRISEISVSWSGDSKKGGLSFMQSDPGCASLLFAAERFVVDAMLGEEEGGFPDEWRERINGHFKEPKPNPEIEGLLSRLEREERRADALNAALVTARDQLRTASNKVTGPASSSFLSAADVVSREHIKVLKEFEER